MASIDWRNNYSDQQCFQFIYGQCTYGNVNISLKHLYKTHSWEHIADHTALRQSRGPSQRHGEGGSGKLSPITKPTPKAIAQGKSYAFYWADPWSCLSRLLHNCTETAGKRGQDKWKSVREEERSVCLWKNPSFLYLGSWKNAVLTQHCTQLILDECNTWYILPPSATEED